MPTDKLRILFKGHTKGYDEPEEITDEPYWADLSPAQRRSFYRKDIGGVSSCTHSLPPAPALVQCSCRLGCVYLFCFLILSMALHVQEISREVRSVFSIFRRDPLEPFRCLPCSLQGCQCLPDSVACCTYPEHSSKSTLTRRLPGAGSTPGSTS